MSEIYDEVKNHFRDNAQVIVNDGRGAQGLKYGKKMFAMFYKGDLTVKLAPAAVQDLIKSGRGLPHDPGTGSPMKDRILIPASKKENWIELCELSLEEMKKS